MSPTQRALKYFRDRGCVCVIITYFNKWAKRRIDIWGADILVRRGAELIAVQASDETSHGKHVTKAMQPDSLVRNWLEADVPYYVYSEGLRGPRGKRKLRTPRITQVMYDTTTGSVIQRELGADKPEATMELELI
jgi:hypothetical protein